MNYLILKNKTEDIVWYINTHYIHSIEVNNAIRVYSIYLSGETNVPHYKFTEEYLSKESLNQIKQFLTMKVNQKEIL